MHVFHRVDDLNSYSILSLFRTMCILFVLRDFSLETTLNLDVTVTRFFVPMSIGIV